MLHFYTLARPGQGAASARTAGSGLRVVYGGTLDRNVDVGDWDGLALHHDRTIGPARTYERSTRLRNSR
jgi:hypothetical protein